MLFFKLLWQLENSLAGNFQNFDEKTLTNNPFSRGGGIEKCNVDKRG